MMYGGVGTFRAVLIRTASSVVRIFDSELLTSSTRSNDDNWANTSRESNAEWMDSCTDGINK